MVERLRNITEGLGWKFYYGRRDFQNLVDAESEDDPKWYFFLDPFESEKTYKIEKQHRGRFMLLSKSDLDEEYDQQTGERDVEEGKWRKYILPKRDYLDNEFEDIVECDGDLEITMRVVDVINLFNTGFDGVLVNFSIKEYL